MTRYGALALFLLGGAATLQARLVNYENNDALARAMAADWQVDPDRKGETRDDAERHYLEYLSQTQDAGQRAKVCFYLGYLYAAGARPEKGEPADYNRAAEYFRRAIDAGGDGICLETIFARTQFASVLPAVDERFEQHLEALEYLKAIDAEAIAARLIPNRPPPPPQAEEDAHRAYATGLRQQVTYLERLTADVADSTRTNALALALSTDVPEVALARLAAKFPGDEVAVRAEEELRRRTAAVLSVEESLASIEEPLQTPPPSKPAEPRELDSASGAAASVDPPSPPPQRTARAAGSDPRAAWRWLIAAACLALLACAGLYWHRRRSSPSDGARA